MSAVAIDPLDVAGLDEPVWAGVQALLDDYVGIESSDDVVIVYTPDSRKPAVWVALALQERGFSPAFVPMLPLRDPGFCERLSRVVPAHRDGRGRCVCLLFELHTMSHNKVVKAVFSNYHTDQYKVVRAINSGRNLFTTGLAVHPNELSRLNTTILDRLRLSTSLRIQTPAGTDLAVQLDHTRFRWLSNRGIGDPGKFIIIPAGEVATFPARIDGTLVADFAININTQCDIDVRLERNPVTAQLRDGALTEFHCDNSSVVEFLNRSFSRPNARRVGELGFGTHRAVKTAVPENSHLNERVPGVHIGFGQHNQTVAAAGYFCDVHIDLCAKAGSVKGDGFVEPMDLATLTPSERPHPLLVNSEDVFSDDAEDDCCGILS